MLAYGTEAPTPSDLPTAARSSTLEFYKKAISSFIPRRMIAWDDIRREGNPTRSIEVNKLIKSVKKCEVRHQGVRSSARRPLEYDEFLDLLTLIRQQNSHLNRLRIVAVLATQWQLIGRIDDMLKLKYDNLCHNIMCEFTAMVRLRWSKNITEEREAPEQVLLGSMDERLCVLLNLGLYLEMKQGGGSTSKADDYVFDCSNVGDKSVRSTLSKAFASSSLSQSQRGPLGTHSVRKGAATYGSRNGLSKDFVQRRGRWRTGASVVDRYIDPTLPYPDAVAAAVLAGPAGPAKYKKKVGVPFLTDAFLIEQVAPGINAVLGRKLAMVFALPILWATLAATPHTRDMMPPSLKDRIIAAVVAAGGDPNEVAVERVSIHVSGDGGMVNFIELGSIDMATTQTTVNPGGSISGSAAFMREIVSVNAQMIGMKHRMEELHTDTVGQVVSEIARLRSETAGKLENIHRAIKRIASQPVVRTMQAESTADVDVPRSLVVAKLPKCPPNLYVLWQEFEFGRCGVKPAKCFTSHERGANKEAYSRRKVFWDTVAKMVRSGYTSDTAIDKIYIVYGRGSSVRRCCKR